MYKGPVEVRHTEEGYVAKFKGTQWFGIPDKYDREVGVRIRVNWDGSLDKMDLMSIKSKLGGAEPGDRCHPTGPRNRDREEPDGSCCRFAAGNFAGCIDLGKGVRFNERATEGCAMYAAP